MAAKTRQAALIKVPEDDDEDNDHDDDDDQLEEVTSLSRKHRVEARAKWGVGWQEGNEDKHRAGGN